MAELSSEFNHLGSGSGSGSSKITHREMILREKKEPKKLSKEKNTDKKLKYMAVNKAKDRLFNMHHGKQYFSENTRQALTERWKYEKRKTKKLLADQAAQPAGEDTSRKQPTIKQPTMKQATTSQRYEPMTNESSRNETMTIDTMKWHRNETDGRNDSGPSKMTHREMTLKGENISDGQQNQLKNTDMKKATNRRFKKHPGKQNLGENTNQPNTSPTHETVGMKVQHNASRFSQALRIADDKKTAYQGIRSRIEQQNEKRRLYLEDKKKWHLKLCKRTKKGQPVMKGRIEYMLAKIEKLVGYQS